MGVLTPTDGRPSLGPTRQVLTSGSEILVCTYSPNAKTSTSGLARLERALNEGSLNTPSAIKHFPTEILVFIFEFAVSAPENATLRPAQAKAPFNVSQVSSLWRGIALNTPNLWCKILAANPWIISTSLARSKNCLLDIELLPLEELQHLEDTYTFNLSHYTSTYLQCMTFKDAAPALHAHIYRWRSAKIHSLDISESSDFLVSPAPQLEVFHAIPPFHLNFRDEPVLLFDNHTPRLRDLLLTRIYVPLSSPMYTNLQRLNLSSISFSETTFSLIQKLAACPLLEGLALRDIDFTSTPTSPSIIASLPRLRTMHLDIKEYSTRYLLASIQAPAGLVLSVALNGGWIAPSILHADNGTLERLPCLARIHTIVIKPDDGAKCCVVVGTSGSPSELKVLRFEYFIGAPEFIGRALPDLGPRFPLPSLQHLTLSSFAGTKLDAEAFLAMLENLPTITSLELTDCPPSFAYALRVDTGSPIVCPLLKRLWLESDPSPGPQRLVEVMKSRANSNRLDRSAVLENSAPLFHLTLRGPNVFDWELVPDLLQLSIVVDWARSEKKTWR